MTQDTLIISSIAAGLAIIGAAILSQLGRWIPNLLHRGRIEEIREAIVSTNAEKLSEMQKQIDAAYRQLREIRNMINELRTGHRILETLREEDKGVMHDLKDRLMRLEEKIDEKIKGLEKRLADDFAQFQIVIMDALRYGGRDGQS